MMCGQHKSEISLEVWLADDICHLDIIQMSSAGGYVIHTLLAGVYVVHMLSAGTYVIRTSSAELLKVSVDLNYLSTVTRTGY